MGKENRIKNYKAILQIMILLGTIALLLLYIPNFMSMIISFIENCLLHRTSADSIHLAKFIRCTYGSLWIFAASLTIACGIRQQISIFYPLYSISSFILTNVEIFMNANFSGNQATCNFSDFTGPIVAGKDTYYPPLQNVIIKCLNRFLLKNTDNAMTYLILLMFFGCLFALFVCAFFYFCIETDKNKYCVEISFIFALFFSSPMIYAYERMNFIILSFVCICIFLLCANRKDYVGNTVSITSLVVAANLKYYPAIYGLILVKRKKWKEALLAVLGGISVFIVSEMWIINAEKSSVAGGFILKIFQTASATSESLGMAGISIKEIIYDIFIFVGAVAPSRVFNYVYIMVLVVFCTISIWVFFISRRNDHELLLLAMLCVFVPPISYNYSLLFLLIPLGLLLKKSLQGMKMLDVIELVLYAIVTVDSYEYYPVFIRGHLYLPVLLLWLLVVISDIWQWMLSSGKISNLIGKVKF